MATKEYKLIKLKENPAIAILHEKGILVKQTEFNDMPYNFQMSVCEFLNRKLPTMWEDDPFIGQVLPSGLYDAWVDEYPDHSEVLVDSDYYRICVAVILVDDWAEVIDY